MAHSKKIMDDRNDLKDISHQHIKELIEQFSHNCILYTQPHSNYNETQLRSDFINQFLQALGWDVYNAKQAPQHLREVVQEDTVEVEESGELLKQNPDYALRLGAERKFFVEVKRPAIPILTDKKAAFQLRRYGWNAGLAVSVLTNFDKLVIYDCRPRPQADDDARVARLAVYDYAEYISKFDEIYEQFGREAVYSGKFDELFGGVKEPEGTEPFDRYFLKQIEQWRMLCAQDLVQHQPALSQEEINFLVQQLLNRIIFLMICEDRELEHYKTLQQIHTYAELKELFRNAEQRYDSGLFDFIEDTFSLTVKLSDNILVRIFQELYYPESPYSFSVVESSVLGEIYELFLAKEIALDKSTAAVREKPEIAASQGVVVTPKYIVDAIVTRTLDPICQGKSPVQLAHLRVADIACGSGSFLLAAYEYLLNHALEWYLRDGTVQPSDKVYQGAQGNWYLTLAEKQRILTKHVFGVDIDPQAVEVTRFSLLLKVLEGEHGETLDAFAKQSKRRALPNLNQNIQCGNSLTDSAYFQFDSDALSSTEQIGTLNPLDWHEAFPAIMQAGGFDAIVGNPPYIRIQNMVRYSPKEAAYYQSEISPYTCARSHNFDKYSLFIERALSLLTPTGRLGYIVPHKFFTIQSGRALRQLLASGQHLDEIVHFGIQQVFGAQRTTYTCLLFLNKQAMPTFHVEHVADIQAWRYGKQAIRAPYPAEAVNDAPWEFVSPQLKALFERLRAENPTILQNVAQIFVGVQTSVDNIYILHPTSETETSVEFTDIEGVSWSLEKAILRPCLHDVALPPFSVPQPNAYIIFPYHISERKACLYSPDEMQQQFPACWKYLNAHKDKLRQRNVQGYTEETWYRYGRSQSLTKFNGAPKLIWPVLSLKPRYVHDEQDIVFTGGGNGPYYALRVLPDVPLSLWYLQAILAHPALEAMVRMRSSVFRGGYWSYGKQFLKDLPIKAIDFADPQEVAVHDALVMDVKQLITARQRETEAKTPRQKSIFTKQARLLRKKVETTVAKLYHLSQDDMRIVDEYLTPNEGDTQ